MRTHNPAITALLEVPPPAPEFVSPDAIVVRYSEIFLKGENRRQFEDVLTRNVTHAVAGLAGVRVRRHHARLLIQAPPGEGVLEDALPRVLRVFGVSSASLAVTVPKELERIAARGAGALVTAARATGAKTFKVRSRRSDKHFPFNTFDLNDVVGRAARVASGLAVDVHDPDVSIVVEIGPELSFVTAHHARGPGGLPVGVSGNVTLMLSGGIDSPVAGWLCQKRGCRLNAVYFHSFPYTGEGTRAKVIELARQLGQSQGGIRLSIVPFTEFQEAARSNMNPRFLVIVYRRAMARIAERVAAAEDASALATGENLGQVASQTIANLGAIEQAITTPMFRPVLTYDKNEIITLARKIGTFDTSVLPFDDCCSLFVPRHPATKVRAIDAARLEKQVPDYDGLLARAFDGREIVDIER